MTVNMKMLNERKKIGKRKNKDEFREQNLQL